MSQVIKSFTVFAPQRSGTNWLEYLITENFHNIKCHRATNNYAWKHEPDARKVYIQYKNNKEEFENHLHLLVTKYVYKWIESIQRNPVDIILRRKQLLDISSCSSAERLKITNNMQVPISWVTGELNLVELVKLWNEFHKSWLDMGQKFKHWGIVKYESLLIQQNRHNFLQSIHKTYKLSKTETTGWNLPIAVPMSPRWNIALTSVKSKDYLNLSNCYSLTPQQIDIIDQLIDKNVLGQLGYSVSKPISS